MAGGGTWSGGANRSLRKLVRSQVFTHAKIRPEDVADRLAASRFEIEAPVSVRRTVLDSFDGRLATAGLRLELCEGHGRELVCRDGASPPAHVTVASSPSFADELPAGPFRARVGPVLGLRALLPVLTVTSRQTTAVRRDRVGKVVVRVVIHDQLVLDGHGPVGPAVGVEVEELVGYEAAWLEVGQLVEQMGLKRRPDELLDVVARRAGISLRGFDGSRRVSLDRDGPAADGFREVLAGLAVTIDANLDGAARAVDPEFLHDLRIAVRRTRAVLGEARGVLPAPDRARFRDGFRWLGSVTSAARDLDVYVTEWSSYVAPLGAATAALLDPVRDHIASRRQEEHAALAEVLRSDRCADLLATWRAWLEAGGAAAEEERARDAGRPLGAVVARRLVAAQDRLVQGGRAISAASPATDLHDLRKEAKKLRYLIECFGGILSAGPRRAFVQQLKAVQENLGEFQDADVHADRLHAISLELHQGPGTTAGTMVAIGRLTEHFEQRGQAARTEFAERFSAYDTKRTRRCLDELVRSAGGR